MLIAAAILIIAGLELPRVGDPKAPAATHVSPRYIEHGHHETGAPNFVTAVLADYRSYDTLGETTVIFTAGLACALILDMGLGRSGDGGDA
jgi:multicomponent Na+:H+ antiporter subunit B